MLVGTSPFAMQLLANDSHKTHTHTQEYNAHLSRIRSFLAGTTRNVTTLTECERLLNQAKTCATAMQGLAEVQGDAVRTREAQQMLQRDVAPLQKEVQRALTEMGRNELFVGASKTAATSSYQAPDIEHGSSDMEALISSSDDLLRESHSILAETEQIGTSTLHQMGRQREQLENTNQHLAAVQQVAVQAKNILQSMSRRACRSKLALYAMIVSLVLANLYVLYRIYKKHHPGKQSG